MTRLYLVTIAPFFSAYILSFILDQAVRNDGRAGFATFVMVSGALINIALDYVFLFVLDMGIAGAALASAIGQSFSATVFLVYFVVKAIRRSAGLRISRPTGGIRVVSAIAVVQYVMMLGAVFFSALGSGSQPVFSQNFGAGQTDRVSQALHLVTGVGALIGLVLGVSVYAGASRMRVLFVPDHPEAIAIASNAIRIVAWSLPLAAVGMMGSVFFTSIEKAGMSLVIAAGRGLVFPLIALAVFPNVWEVNGIWLVAVTTELAGAVVTMALLGRWNKEVRRPPEVLPAPVGVEGV